MQESLFQFPAYLFPKICRHFGNISGLGIGKAHFGDEITYHFGLTFFTTFFQLMKILKMKDITRKAAIEYRRIIKAHLLVIDDIMMFPVTKEEAVTFFNLINELHDQTSLIITTNKSPKQWAEVLQDTVITTALLDRILFRCETIKLNGNSYRMKNRKTIFKQPIK